MLALFLKDSVIYGLTKVITSSSHLILLPIYTNFLAMKEYGIVDYLAILANIIIIIIPLEISQGFARYFSEANSKEEKSAYLSTSLWFVFLLFSVFSLLVVFLSDQITLLLFDTNDYSHVIVAAAFAFSGQGLFVLVQNHLRYQHKVKLYSIVSIIYTVILVLGISLMLINHNGGIIHILYMQLVAGIVAASIGLYFRKSYYKFKMDREKLVNMLSFSFPLVLSSAGVFVSLYVDRIIIKDILGFNDLAIYSAGYRIATMVSLALVGFQMALTPLIYRNYKNKNAPVEIEKMLRWFLAITLPIILFASIFSRELIQLFTTPEYLSAFSVVFPLSLSFLFLNMYLFAPGLWIAKKTIQIGILNIVAAMLNIVLNYIFIPYYGILGAALATCVSAIFGFLGYLIVGQRLYSIPYKWKPIVISLFITILTVYFMVYNQEVFGKDGYIHTIHSFKASVILFISCIFLFILISKGELYALCRHVSFPSYKK